MLGVSRQAFYKTRKIIAENSLRQTMIVKAVQVIRRRQPRVGTRKLQRMFLQRGFKISRDKLFETLRDERLLIRPKRNYKRTTNSFHRYRKYQNLIRGKNINGPNQVFVADITYLDTAEGFSYLALLTDVYSRKIVGWAVSKNLSIECCQGALRMALKNVKNPEKLIHHSDRGLQYCSYAYTRILQKQKIQISMTEENHVYENALAERVNGILKTEFLLGEKLPSHKAACRLVSESIKTYNEERLHIGINYQIPAERYAA
jgi:putative transposase